MLQISDPEKSPEEFIIYITYMNDKEVQKLGQDIFDSVYTIESVAFRGDSKNLSEEFGSYTQNSNQEKSKTVDMFRITNGIAIVTIDSAPGFPDDWKDVFAIGITINDELVLRGQILKAQHAQSESIFKELIVEELVEGSWVEDFNKLANLYNARLEEAKKINLENRQKIDDDRIKRRLEENNNN